jgi:D-alanine-D-alanine ligase
MMRIGLVYDLRDDYRAMGFTEEQVVEFDSVETIDGMAGALERLGHTVDRIGHGRKLAQRLVLGDRWDLIWSIAEGLSGRSREAQVPALLEMYDQPYAFSDPLTMALALDKAMAKRIVRDHGVPTAPFLVMEAGSEDISAWNEFPAFVKPIAEGTGKGCELASKVMTKAELVNAARGLIHRFRQAALVEAFLPGREFTVGIVGNGSQARVVGIMEILLKPDADAGVYTMRNKEQSEELCQYVEAEGPLAQLVAERGLAAFKALGCRDSCRLDFRCDASGSPVFMEANPIAGLHPTHSDLPILSGLNGISYDQLIGLILEAALDRYGLGALEARRIHRRKVG